MGESAKDDSYESSGGCIPGTPNIAAFRVFGDGPSALPVMISVPHAGRAYPPALLREMRHPEAAALKLEDRYVDRLARAVAQETGVALLIAQAPRAMIDLNRAPEDIDWDMFEVAARPGATAGKPGEQPSRRARSGLGLIPRRLPGVGELWRRPHETQDLAARMDQVHEPYHCQLAAMLETIRERWGVALLVDLHSMPPLVPRPGQTAAQFVIGDRFGTTCHGSLVGTVFAQLAKAGRPAAHNRPYAGGYVLERHARTASGIHAMQIEVDRSCYLDRRMAEPGLGFDAVVAILAGIIRRLAADIVELSRSGSGESWPLAAE